MILKKYKSFPFKELLSNNKLTSLPRSKTKLIILLKKAKNNYLYANCIEIVESTKKRLEQNANYDMSIDNMLFNIWEEVN